MPAKHPAAPKSRILAEVHATARGFHAAGVMDDRRMKRFDDLCLPKAKPAAKPAALQVTIKPSIAAVFTSAKAVNDALEGLLRLANPEGKRTA